MDEKHQFLIETGPAPRHPSRHFRSAVFLAAIATLALGAIAQAAKSGTTTAAHRAQGQARAAKSQTLPPIDEAYGSKGAPITFEVFSDYSCPMCRNLYEQTLRPMINDYVAAGKVYLVHRDYPLAIPGHQNSPQAARWARAAARIGQFENVDAAFYDNQTSWATDGNLEKYVAAAMSTADFKRVQKMMEGCEPPGPTGKPDGINLPPHPCSLDPYIEQDILAGNQVPVKGTPTFVITYKGQRYPPGSGFVSWPLLKQFLDSLLSQ
ncbi:MAG TPA: thioredoxin domain-containing protein [Candidatus Acidoferrum sp.]|nr:thioredoxin domain-containing protein [Candidatus Acidoferrum sp.]